ncbi:bifunctional adenosylcobinamide kinase/adenosylcobinamide-phosphate guanylyltransferase [Shewanella livingstonensis]|uniref:Bifunctional adenosylcobalamin biosynthesis protein n=1 Tax=Shewanella livingstonensis TaxID=150120 RepID=A0A3G8LV72_9GAMM|nr:bifunctional adenosylcobinamide kinase/adenosylcobinamide-phosphate guanylyltransferase [Shewanella livingstonensis]AZG73294.1 bifunctional adenosylcobinamide kinase/adenosylcobinamide-phosphate guanylyltransferase [Shewanella livingstonensis]
MKQLIIGGARSGKSTLATKTALTWQNLSGGKITLIVTAQPDGVIGSEMSKRIVHHQMNRPSDWDVIEAWTDLAEAIDHAQADNTLILVDCLTLWLANELMSNEGKWLAAKARLLSTVANSHCPIIMIGNEVGQGVVPMGEFNRKFVDELGWLHQHLGAVVDTVTVCIAGLPMILKSKQINSSNSL